MPTPEREKLIRSVWENIGRPRWNDDVNGKGVPLFAPVSEDMQTARPGQPIRQLEQLEFRLLSPSMSGYPLPASSATASSSRNGRLPAAKRPQTTARVSQPSTRITDD
jgi:hypothetical protein